MTEPDHAEVEKLSIALGKVIKGFMERREPVPARILEMYNALAIVTASVLATTDTASLARERAMFLAYLDDALGELNAGGHGTSSKPN